MATTSNILTLLKFYASHQNSGMIEYNAFADYLKRYSQHHLEENQDLIVYIGSDDSALQSEIAKLVESHQVVIVTHSSTKKYLCITAYFLESYAKLYKEIEGSITIPFPNINDLPKSTPTDILVQRPGTETLHKFLAEEGKPSNTHILYALNLGKNIPALIYPSSVPVSALFSIALAKIQEMLHKEEYHDYFRKKLVVSNPGKEMTAKKFFDDFMRSPDAVLDNLKDSGENFYFWSQLFYFIRQDYDKVKELTIEDINILQSISIMEGITSYLKSRVQEKKQKETAFASLMIQLKKTPYYFSYGEIIKFKDQNGIPLLGQYSEEELKEWLQQMTTQSDPNDLPSLLIIKVTDEQRYFILKEKVMALVVHLCSDARVTVKKNLAAMWTKLFLEWETIPEMNSTPEFEKCLQREVQATQPILYALLNSSFLPLISYYDPDESDNSIGRLTLFRDGILISYSEILMIARQEILTDVKIKLPFWYTMPVISWIAALLMGKKKIKKRKKTPSKSAAELAMEKHKADEAVKEQKLEQESKGDEKASRKQELHKAAVSAEQVFVPSNSTLDRELQSYCHDWNNLIGKEAHNNLTDDVNSLIRDYMRRVLRTLHSSGFTPDRIKSLAETLVNSPSMLNIKNHEALERYIVLYIIKLVKNIP